MTPARLDMVDRIFLNVVPPPSLLTRSSPLDDLLDRFITGGIDRVGGTTNRTVGEVCRGMEAFDVQNSPAQ